MTGPASLLAGIRVLDLGAANAALAGRLVAELGAEVLRLEPPGGDPTRALGPWAHGAPDPDGSLTFAALDSGKLSVVLDPARPDAATILAQLASGSDAVLLSSASPWSDLVDADAIAADGTPVVAVAGFAPGGPYEGYRDPEIVTFALGGLLYISGDPDRAPCIPPEPLSQSFASVWAALALVSAVWASRVKARAAVYRVSVHEALATQEHLVRAAAMDGEPIVRNGSQHKSVAPATVFPTADGFVYIYVSRNHWAAFLKAWSPHPSEFDDPKYLPNSVRRAHAATLNPAVAEWTRQHRSRDLVARLQEGGVPCLPVNRPSGFVEDDQVVARRLFADVSHPRLGTFRQIRFPAMIDEDRPEATRPPLLGEHTDEVLGRFGARETGA